MHVSSVSVLLKIHYLMNLFKLTGGKLLEINDLKFRNHLEIDLWILI